MSIANTHCTKSNIKPDWGWYYDLCGIVGIDTRYNSEKKPLVVAKPKVKKQGIYARWEAPKDVNEIEVVRSSIIGFEKQLEKPEDYWNPRSALFEVNKSAAKNFLLMAQRNLKILESQHDRALTHH